MDLSRHYPAWCLWDAWAALRKSPKRCCSSLQTTAATSPASTSRLTAAWPRCSARGSAQPSTKEQNMNSVLFQPFRMHDLSLRNRIILSPMTRGRAGTARIPNRLMAEYYAQRSSAGLLITEATTISEEAEGWSESPGIYTDAMTEGWKQTTSAVHEKGGVIFLQR